MTNSIFGIPYFTDNAKIECQYPYLTEDIDCEAAVIGGGIAGALCAYSLTEAGVDTVLLDSSLIGFGSSAISSSIIQYDIDYDLCELKKIIGISNAVRAYRLCLESIDNIEELSHSLDEDVGFARRDSLYFTQDVQNRESIKDEFLIRRHSGFPVSYLDSVKASEYFPFKIESAIYSHDAAAEINPYKFIHALIKKACSSGLKVFENTTVESVNSEFSGVTLETSTRHRIHAKKIVNATGLTDVSKARHITQAKTTFCIVTEPLSDLSAIHNRAIIREDSSPYFYLRTLPDDRILIGGLDSRIIRTAINFSNFISIENSINRRFDMLKEKLCTIIPGGESIKIDYKFAGSSADTGDGLPYIGTRENYPNVYFDICCGLNGIAFAKIGADIIRDLYLNGKAKNQDLFAFGRI